MTDTMMVMVIIIINLFLFFTCRYDQERESGRDTNGFSFRLRLLSDKRRKKTAWMK